MTNAVPEVAEPAWSVTPLGHSCVLVAVPDADGGTSRILLDPGDLTPPLDGVEGVDAVLVTHDHPDHLDVDQVARLRRGGRAPVHGDPDAMARLSGAGVHDAGLAPPHRALHRALITRFAPEGTTVADVHRGEALVLASPA